MHTVTFTTPLSGQTAVFLQGPFAVVRHEFTLKKDTFYTVRDCRTGRDLSYSFRRLANAKRHLFSAMAAEGAAIVAGRTF